MDIKKRLIELRERCGLTQNGGATVKVQQKLFSKNAPEYSGYIVLSRGDENARVERLQRRLKELGYYTYNVTGYFGKSTPSSVSLFQQKVGMRPTGPATIEMQERLFAPDAPAKNAG